MTHTAANAWTAPSSIVTATVRSVDAGRVGVESPSFGVASARLATFGPYQPNIGDAVLVASADGAFFVIGVLRALREIEVGDTEQRIVARDGSSASLEESEDGAVFRLRDREGALIFEHRPGESVVHVEHDLRLSAGGDLALEAKGELRMTASERVLVASDAAIDLTSQDASLRVDRDRARLTAPLIEADATRADVKIGEANLVAGTLRTVVHRAIDKVDLVERQAGRIVERAREVYREVEELSQTKAGRLKLIADEALSLLGRQTTVQAREDVKVKGEKIYLG